MEIQTVQYHKTTIKSRSLKEVLHAWDSMQAPWTVLLYGVIHLWYNARRSQSQRLHKLYQWGRLVCITAWNESIVYTLCCLLKDYFPCYLGCNIWLRMEHMSETSPAALDKRKTLSFWWLIAFIHNRAEGIPVPSACQKCLIFMFQHAYYVLDHTFSTLYHNIYFFNSVGPRLTRYGRMNQ